MNFRSIVVVRLLATLLGCAAAFVVQAATPAAKSSAPNGARPAAAAAGYTVEPTPGWVLPAPPEPAGLRLEAAPMHYALLDEQLQLDERGGTTAYQHVVRVVDEAAGLAQAAQLELVFDPAYQTLALHQLEVVRDGKRLNRLDRTRIRVLQRETELERQMVDGRLTVSVVVPDVRVGDRIDYAYSRRGANPVFAGRFFYSTLMGAPNAPVATARLRLLAPAGRTLHLQAGSALPAPQERVAAGWRDTQWLRTGLPQLRTDPNAPASAWLPHQAFFSEQGQWAEVSRWGEGLFAEPGPQRAVDAKAAELRAATPDRAEQLRLALAFVQREIRYFGTEEGLHSHRPVPPERVLAQRHGDCKDKVGLLVALLRRLDIAATPVLVSSSLRGDVAMLWPSPLAFDHAIVRVVLDGQTYWFDATRDQQTGTLANRQAQGFLRGLVLDGSSTALAVLPGGFDQLRMQVEDRVQVGRFPEPAQLVSRITYRGDLADLYRAWLAARSPEDVANAMAEPYLKLYPAARSTAALKVERSEDDDAITLVQAFELPGFWRYPEQRVLVAELGHWSIAQALAVPKAERRRDALALPYPGRYRHVITLQLPEAVWRQPASQRHEEPANAAIALKTTMEAARDRAEFVTDLRIGTDRIEASAWQQHLDRLTRHFPHLSSQVTVSPIPLAAMPAMEQALQAQEKALRNRQVVARTKLQADAVFRTAVLDAHLAGGRLAPDQQAQALRLRGVQYDIQGDPARARVDFDRALELAPEDADTLQAAAVNAMALHRFDRAITLADGALRQRPGDAAALDVRARAHYLRGEWSDARADWQSVLEERAAAQRGLAVIWLSLLERQAGHDPAALADRLDELPAGVAATWPRPLLEYMLGRRSLDEVVQAAKSDAQPLAALCEAYFYIGERFRVEGNVAKAQEYWHKAAAQGVTEYLEDGVARFRLAGNGP